jgi:hypothetical protein
MLFSQMSQATDPETASSGADDPVMDEIDEEGSGDKPVDDLDDESGKEGLGGDARLEVRHASLVRSARHRNGSLET